MALAVNESRSVDPECVSLAFFVFLVQTMCGRAWKFYDGR